MKQLPLIKPDPNMLRFKNTILGREIPKRPPLIELFFDAEVMKQITEEYLGRTWVPFSLTDLSQRAKFWDNYIEVYYRLGFDFVWYSGGGVHYPGSSRKAADTAALAKETRHWDEEGTAAISDWADYERYPWPSGKAFDFWDIEYLSEHLYEGMGIFTCPGRGFLEVPLEIILGYENFSYLLYDEPDLVKAVCQRVGEITMGYFRQVSRYEKVIGFFPGDDMGFKSATLIAPQVLRSLILPWHKQAAQLAHSNDKLYLLHSCGNLEEIMGDLIEDVKIDAKHSFEEQIMPVTEFKKKYGDRIAVLGGVDVDYLCRLKEKPLRAYIQQILDVCMKGGRYALGTGNSVANYIPLENYLIMVEEGLKWG